MNKTIVWTVTIIVTGSLIGLYLYLQNSRFYIQSTAKGFAYKIDRKTGKTWVIDGGMEYPVVSMGETSKALAPEEEAIVLAKLSRVLDEYSSAESVITDWLRKKKGNLRVIGWKARKITDQTYLVSYTFEQESGVRGYFFEVNLVAEIVRFVSEDPELSKKYGIKTKTVGDLFEDDEKSKAK